MNKKYLKVRSWTAHPYKYLYRYNNLLWYRAGIRDLKFRLCLLLHASVFYIWVFPLYVSMIFQELSMVPLIVLCIYLYLYTWQKFHSKEQDCLKLTDMLSWNWNFWKKKFFQGSNPNWVYKYIVFTIATYVYYIHKFLSRFEIYYTNVVL